MAKTRTKPPKKNASTGAYEVLVPGLTYPTDPATVDRLRAGENLPWAQRGMCDPHDVGDRVDDIPKNYLDDALAQGLVRRADTPDGGA